MIVIFAVVLIFIIALLNAVPLALFGMLFLGNLGLHLGFWTCLPGALALKIALSNNTVTPTNKD